MTTISGVPVRDLVELATRAPSVHNTQPWYWCADGDRVSLFADFSRQLPYADPDGRDRVVSCGAALHHLRIAADHGARRIGREILDRRRRAGAPPVPQVV